MQIILSIVLILLLFVIVLSVLSSIIGFILYRFSSRYAIGKKILLNSFIAFTTGFLLLYISVAASIIVQNI
ncbi:MAG: hypothetical protein ACE3JK_02740 [Sporolactobacillus sp.]